MGLSYRSLRISIVPIQRRSVGGNSSRLCGAKAIAYWHIKFKHFIHLVTIYGSAISVIYNIIQNVAAKHTSSIRLLRIGVGGWVNGCIP